MDHRGRHGRDLFGSSPEWLNLRLECGERWAQVRSLLRIHRRLVVLHGVDDVRCRKLPRGSRSPSHSNHSSDAYTPYLKTAANYIVSELLVFEVNYPGGAGNDSIQWRALVWAVAEGYFIAGILVNYLPPRLYSSVFKFAMMLYIVDFLLCVIWLPIGVSRTYGFRSAKEVFTGTCKLRMLRRTMLLQSTDGIVQTT